MGSGDWYPELGTFRQAIETLVAPCRFVLQGAPRLPVVDRPLGNALVACEPIPEESFALLDPDEALFVRIHEPYCEQIRQSAARVDVQAGRAPVL